MDRIDKVLLVFPVLPIADLLSTLFSLSLGGEEVGILARPILTQFGPSGLVMLAASASIILMVSMQVVIYIKSMFVERWNFKWTQCFLAIPICWFFLLEGVYVSTVVMNILVALSPVLAQTIALRIVLVCTYFACVAALTVTQFKQLRISS